MKKFSVLLTLLLVMVSSSVFAGSIDYLSNQSAKFLMTFTRNASTDASADIANYNPAGTAFLAEGFYIDVSNQTLFKPYATKTNTYPAISYQALTLIPTVTSDKIATTVTSEFEQSKPTTLLPNVYMVYNFGDMGGGKLAAYCHVGISAGGGSLSWDDGTVPVFSTLSSIFKNAASVPSYAGTAGIVNHQRFDVSSVYYTAHIGASYALIENMFSLSLGAKGVKAERTLGIYGDGYGVRNGNAALGPLQYQVVPMYIDGKYSYDATGYAPVIGINIKPVEQLNLSARYEHKIKLGFEYDENLMHASNAPGNTTSVVELVSRTTLSKVGIADGKKMNYDLPQILALGAEFKVTPEFTVMTSANIYYLAHSNMGKAYDATDTAYEDAKDVNDYFGTGWETSIAATYLVTSELKLGVGYIWTQSGAKESYFNDSRTFLNCAGNPPLDSWTIGSGLTYTLAGTGADITLAGSWTHYIPEHYNVMNPDGTFAGATSNPAQPMVAGSYHKDVYNIGLGVGYKI